MKYFLNEPYVPKKGIPSVPKKESFLALPYLGTIPSNLKQKFRTCFKNLSPQCNIKIILKLTNRLSSVFHFKFVTLKEF